MPAGHFFRLRDFPSLASSGSAIFCQGRGNLEHENSRLAGASPARTILGTWPGQVSPAFEKPERAEIVLKSLEGSQLGSVITPVSFGEDTALAVHDADYLDFLKTAHAGFQELGLEGDPTACVWPRGRMRADSSDSIVAKFGRYCFDGVAITQTTYEAIVASRDIALTAAQLVEQAIARPLHSADRRGTMPVRITQGATVF